MGSLEIRIIDKRKVDTIHVKRAVQILDAVYSLYYNLGISNEELKKYPKNLFKLELSGVHFSDAKIVFKTTHEYKPFPQDSEIFSKPIKAVVKIIELEGDMKSKQALDLLISKKRTQRKVLQNFLNLIPQKETERIEIQYKSPYLSQPIKIPNITFELRKPINSLKKIIKSKNIKEKNVIGILKGIVTTTRNKYLLIEGDDSTIVKCFYTEDSFKSGLEISDLRVTKDILMLTGRFLEKEGKKASDKLIDITEIFQIISVNDYYDEIEIGDQETTMELTEKRLENLIVTFKNFKKVFKSESKRILALEDGWDLPSSKGYEKRTLILGLLYLSKIKILLKENYGKDFPLPMLFPGSSGGIEFEWDDKINFQISIPSDTAQLIGIYGYNKKDNEELLIDCKLFEVNEKLLNWLNLLL